MPDSSAQKDKEETYSGEDQPDIPVSKEIEERLTEVAAKLFGGNQPNKK